MSWTRDVTLAEIKRHDLDRGHLSSSTDYPHGNSAWVVWVTALARALATVAPHLLHLCLTSAISESTWLRVTVSRTELWTALSSPVQLTPLKI